MKPGSATLVVLVPALVCVAVQALPTGHKTGGHVPDEVEQLDQLRKVAGLKGAKMVEKESSHMVSVDGKVRASSTKEKTVKDAQTDSTLASVKQSSQLEQVRPGERPHSVSRTQVDVPALGIHETKIEDSNQPQQSRQQQQRLPVPAEKKNYGLYPWNAEEQDRSDYTPTDLAEYILRTGDEEGVAIAVEELLRQGMMSREEAIVYLQDVKAEMNYIRAQQEKLRKIQELREAISMKKKDELKAQHRLGEGFGPREHPPKAPTKAPQKAPQGKPTAKSPTKAAASKEVAPPSSAAVATENKAVPAAAHGSDASKSKAARVDAGGAEAAQKRDSAAASNKLGVLERLGEEQRQRQQEADGLLRRLRGPSPYDEYTLEEIIYWLAKDMFAHSIVKGDQSAEEALARFANFVETEVSQNKLSGEVEKKVLDIMLAALVDILREFPGPQYSGTNPLPPQRLFPEATENQAAKLANARLRNAAIRLREEKKKTIPAVIKHKELPTAAQKS